MLPDTAGGTLSTLVALHKRVFVQDGHIPSLALQGDLQETTPTLPCNPPSALATLRQMRAGKQSAVICRTLTGQCFPGTKAEDLQQKPRWAAHACMPAHARTHTVR